MKRKSLTLRLALLAAAGSTVALLLAGLLFTSLFRQAVERNFDSRLEFLLTALVGAEISENGTDQEVREPVGEPRFGIPLSGWYWQIRAAESGEVIAASQSLFGDNLPETPIPPEDGEIVALNLTGPDGVRLRALERRIVSEDKVFALLVAGDADDLAEQIARFSRIVSLTLLIFALFLALGAALLIRFGLRPLRDVRAALRRVRLGDSASLEGDYPIEIEPLVSDLNALIGSNREIIERSRTHVGNLAHALKTPIAVLQNEAAGTGELASTVREQVASMQHQITHHLDRAQIAAQSKVIGVITPVGPTIEGLARVMRKVHQERDLKIVVDQTADLRFRGEKQDLEEMIGNLLDNACKWAKSEIRLSARTVPGGRNDRLVVSIDDDGPGLTEEQRKQVLSRGKRIDQSVPGSGLGLSIVEELVRVYGGRLALESSESGGLSVKLELPLAFDR
jgi:signal transduction histidine kinase